MERLIPAWGGSAPTGVIILARGTALPLVVRIRTTCPPATLDSYLNIACAWVLPRERTWTQGLTAKKRTENRHYTMRSVSQVRLDGTLKRMFRYGEGGLTPLAKHRVTDGQMPWFWQITGALGSEKTAGQKLFSRSAHCHEPRTSSATGRSLLGSLQRLSGK